MCFNILWRREHNRQARKLSAANKDWDDEKIYQEARKRVIALMQHFYETEYIPMLLGSPNIPKYGGYDSTIDPRVDFFFNTVSLRYGHTQVNNVTLRLNEDRSKADGGDLLLRNIFFDPTILDNGGCSPIYRGLSAVKHNSPEVNIVVDLQEFLFAKKGSLGLDLLSTNMRRSRDIGLANYGNARTLYNFPKQTTFNYSEWADNFRKVYKTDDPSECEPWICCLLESGINNGELGDVNHEVVVRQFRRFREGDRFWYEAPGVLDQATLDETKKTRLSDIILRNSAVKSMKCDVFEVPGDPYTGTEGPECHADSTTGTAGTTSSASAFVASALLVLFAVVALVL
jgi:hypothetical protein